MSVYKRLALLVVLWLIVARWLAPSEIIAAPTFFINGTSSGYFKDITTWDLVLNTDGQLLTAAQVVVHFDSELFNQVRINNLNSRCSFWSPADPSLGYGNSVTPYFYNGNSIVAACGFSNPGYITASGMLGDRILSFSLEPYYLGTATFTLTDAQFRFVDAVIAPGAMPSFDYVVDSTQPATATPSPTPAPSPTPIPPTPTTLRASDLNLVSLSASRSGTRTANSLSTTPQLASPAAVAQTLDDTIPPPPPNLEPRPPATPYPTVTENQITSANNGEVLSVQSLRELLIPGKSDADRRLVVFNLVAMLIFLILLAMLIWRLILTKRAHDLKIKHMNELIEGELSVIESKVQAVKAGQGTSEEVVKSLEELKRELDSQEKR